MKLGRRMGLVAAIFFLFLTFPQPSAAALGRWVYRADSATDNGAARALPGIRILRDWSQRHQLSAAERASLQPDFLYRALLTPNDPYYPLQWNFSQIQLPGAWLSDTTDPLYGGDPAVVVAVLDTGLAYEHYQSFIQAPDFSTARIWSNADEINGDGIDNDGNGYVDDLHGWDFISQDAHPNDDNGHGTHVAGTIAASTNDGVGAAGIAFNTTLMPLKVLDGQGNGSTSTITAAMEYAIANGANIINLSLGGQDLDPLLQASVQKAASRGILLIGAAGNNGAGSLNYPAKFDQVISVAAVQYDQTRPAYSNYGTGLDLVAPGGNVFIDQNSDGQTDGIAQQSCTSPACTGFGTYLYSGTSQAAAHVSGVAALLLACGATPGSILSTLQASATDLGDVGPDIEYGAGLLNAQAAMAQAGCSASAPPRPGPITATASNSVISPMREHAAYPFTSPRFSWTGLLGATYEVRFGQAGKSTTPTVQASTTYEPALSSEGVYKLEVRSRDGLGRTSEARTFTFRYRRPGLIVGLDQRIQLRSPTFGVKRELSGPFSDQPVWVRGGTLEADGTQRLLAMTRESGNLLKVIDDRGRLKRTLKPFGGSFRGAIDAAVMQSAGKPGLIVAVGRSRGCGIAWYTASGTLRGQLKNESGYTGGCEVESGDIDGDGVEEAIVARSKGGVVAIYNRDRQRLRQIVPFGTNYRGGVTVAAGDIDGDGSKEIFITARSKAAKRTIMVYSGAGTLAASWVITSPNNASEVTLVAADLSGDGRDELIVLNRTGAARVKHYGANGTLQSSRTISQSSKVNALGVLR